MDIVNPTQSSFSNVLLYYLQRILAASSAVRGLIGIPTAASVFFNYTPKLLDTTASNGGERIWLPEFNVVTV
jgi:hypothetical protein